jgi:hypothetical protein
MTRHHNVIRHHKPPRRYKMCRGAALLRPMSARSIRSNPVPAIASQIAGFRLNTTEVNCL